MCILAGMAGDHLRGPGAGVPEEAGAPGTARSTGGGQDELRAAVRSPRFPTVMRGYEREAVDDYVVTVNRLIAGLEAGQSPEAAVKRALDEVGEETSAILQRARETAEQITARSRAQADERLRHAEREAESLAEEAEARVRQLEAGTEGLWRERGRLLEELRALGARVIEVSDAAERRFPARMLRPGVEEPADAAAGADTATLPAVEPEEEAVDQGPAASGATPVAGAAAPTPAEEVPPDEGGPPQLPARPGPPAA